MEHESLISVIMPFFNCQNTLPAAICSILNQTYENWELLLYDDGSSDQSLEVARIFHNDRIKILQGSTRLGLATRLNQCVAESNGNFVARMDADDISYPTRLEKQLAYLTRHPEVDLLGTSALVFKENYIPVGKRAFPINHEGICANPMYGFKMTHPTWFAKREWFIQNPYDPKYQRSQDRDLLRRTYHHSKFANLDEILLGYRDDLNLKKMLRSRILWINQILNEDPNGSSIIKDFRHIAPVLAKMAIECVAVAMGLDHKLLRHRARKISTDEKSTWMTVWQNCSFDYDMKHVLPSETT